MSRDQELFFVAQIGRTVGLKGDLKLHLHTDFPDQFFEGATLRSDRGELKVARYDPKRSLIRFAGYDTPEDARRLTNSKIYSNEEETRKHCALNEGEYFWFDIIGSKIVEGELPLGTVKDIHRLSDLDYLLIETGGKLLKQGYAKNFLIPYIPRYIVSVDSESSLIFVKDAFGILEAS